MLLVPKMSEACRQSNSGTTQYALMHRRRKKGLPCNPQATKLSAALKACSTERFATLCDCATSLPGFAPLLHLTSGDQAFGDPAEIRGGKRDGYQRPRGAGELSHHRGPARGSGGPRRGVCGGRQVRCVYKKCARVDDLSRFSFFRIELSCLCQLFLAPCVYC